MKSRPRLMNHSYVPLLLPLLLSLITLACSETKSAGTQTPKQLANQTQKMVDNPQTPLATHVVYSPLVGSGGTPAAPASSLNVSITVSPKILKVGEKVTVTIKPGNSESPFYYLFLGDSGADDVTYAVGVSMSNEVFPGESTSKILELVSADGAEGQAIFVLQGVEVGTTEVWASVAPSGANAGSVVAGGVSQRVTITVKK
jgi:hypothetical protein